MKRIPELRLPSRRHSLRNLLCVCMLVLVFSGLICATTTEVSAHAELIEASPPADGLLVVPPHSIELRMSETVSEGAGSPSIGVIDQQGRELNVTDVGVKKDDKTRVSARVSGITTGTYTVLWTVRSEVDGHTLSGSYSFRVGEGRAPGAAVVEGQSPRAWAIATRWATFIGASLATGAFLALLFGFTCGRQLKVLRLLKIAAVGSLVALCSSGIEPILASLFPPPGISPPAITDAFSGLPAGWWLRPIGALLTISIILISRSRIGRSLSLTGLAFSLTIVAGLSLTSHAAARPSWRAIATIVNLIHLTSIALWLGGLSILVLSWKLLAANVDVRTASIRAFSRTALPLMTISLITGLANAGFVFPAPRLLWSSDYGTIVLIKVAIIVPILALAAAHRRVLGKVDTSLPSRFGNSLKLETLLGAVVIILAASLALLSPPRVESDTLKSTSIALPAYDTQGDVDINVVLTLAPAKSGENALSVNLINQDRSAYTGPLPAKVIAKLSSLEFPAVSGPFDLAPEPNATFTTSNAIIGLDGWWNIDLTLRWLGEEDVTLSYFVLLPDVNVFGLDAVNIPDSNPAGAELFTIGMEHMTGLHTVRYWQSMSDNKGGVAYAEHIVNDGSDGVAPPGYIYRAPGRYEAYVIGTTGWMLENGEWEVLQTGPMVPPARWDDEYQNATGFRLGNTEVIDGEICQIVTFVVPAAERQVVSYYAWWVGTETGNVRRDVMVSRAHYMTNNFVEFNTNLPLTLPSDAPPDPFTELPAGTPVAAGTE